VQIEPVGVQVSERLMVGGHANATHTPTVIAIATAVAAVARAAIATTITTAVAGAVAAALAGAAIATSVATAARAVAARATALIGRTHHWCAVVAAAHHGAGIASLRHRLHHAWAHAILSGGGTAKCERHQRRGRAARPR